MRDVSLRTSISLFSSIGGRQQSRAANVRAVEPATDLPGADRGNLYMLVEVTNAAGGHPAMYRRILDAAQKSFYEAEGTLSAALQRAVRAAHSELRKINEALPEAAWRAGMSCLALQGGELVIAQVNPALVVVSHTKTIDLFPPEVQPNTQLLGGAERPDVQLVRTEVEPGSMILLAESRWLAQVRPEVLAAAATGETPGQVVDYLGQLGGEADLTALIIGLSKDIPEVLESAAPRPLPPTEPGKSSPAEETVAAAAVATTAAEGKRGWFGRRSKPEPAPAQVEPEPELAPEPVAMVAEPVIEERPRRSPWPLILALVIIPLLIAIVVLSVWWLRNQGQETEFQKQLSGATAAIASVQGVTDENAVRQRLTSAKEFLDKAKAIRPDDSRLQPVLARYDENMDKVNHVTPLYGTVPLWNFTADKLNLARILVKGNQVYVLDKGQQQISRFTMVGLGDSVKPAEPPVVLAKGQQVKNSDQVITDLIDIGWVDAASNQPSRLVTLDTNGGLYSYDVNLGPARLNIGGREQWGVPQLMAGYSGNLYLVDPKANQIWRYKPTDKGYENAPERYFAPGNSVDLAGVQSIAIDGNIWLLYADGRLLKFFGGEQKPFELKGLPSPLSSPVAVVASAEGDQLYIADAGNGRIIEVNKSGQFQRQFRPAQPGVLHEMRDLYLDEAGAAMYILTNNQLIKANLPKAAPATSATAAPAAPAASPSPTPSPTPQK
jgi:hypothetical protein